MEVVKAIRATVTFFEGLEVDGYKMPDGEFRIGLSGASLVLGYSHRWLNDAVSNKSPRTAKALSNIGFSRFLQKVLIQSKQRNSYHDTTISLSDFNCCIIYAVQNKKKAAIALQKSFTQLALNDFFRDAFGDPPLTISQKRELIDDWWGKKTDKETKIFILCQWSEAIKQIQKDYEQRSLLFNKALISISFAILCFGINVILSTFIPCTSVINTN